jgi:hypothetical protein
MSKKIVKTNTFFFLIFEKKNFLDEKFHLKRILGHEVGQCKSLTVAANLNRFNETSKPVLTGSNRFFD